MEHESLGEHGVVDASLLLGNRESLAEANCWTASDMKQLRLSHYRFIIWRAIAKIDCLVLDYFENERRNEVNAESAFTDANLPGRQLWQYIAAHYLWRGFGVRYMPFEAGGPDVWIISWED